MKKFLLLSLFVSCGVFGMEDDELPPCQRRSCDRVISQRQSSPNWQLVHTGPIVGEAGGEKLLLEADSRGAHFVPLTETRESVMEKYLPKDQFKAVDQLSHKIWQLRVAIADPELHAVDQIEISGSLNTGESVANRLVCLSNMVDKMNEEAQKKEQALSGAKAEANRWHVEIVDLNRIKQRNEAAANARENNLIRLGLLSAVTINIIWIYRVYMGCHLFLY